MITRIYREVLQNLRALNVVSGHTYTGLHQCARRLSVVKMSDGFIDNQKTQFHQWLPRKTTVIETSWLDGCIWSKVLWQKFSHRSLGRPVNTTSFSSFMEPRKATSTPSRVEMSGSRIRQSIDDENTQDCWIMQRQLGFPKLFITIASYEWSFSLTTCGLKTNSQKYCVHDCICQPQKRCTMHMCYPKQWSITCAALQRVINGKIILYETY